MKNKSDSLFTKEDSGITLSVDTGLLESHESRTAATAPQRLPASSIQRGLKRGAFMASYQFDTAEACLFGVESAIILQNLRFWIKKNEANGKHFHEERFWTYNSTKAFAALFPFWEAKKIGRILTGLEEQGIILSGNFNPIAYDRTKWYTINEEAISQKATFHFPELVNGFPKSGQPIPDIKPVNKPDVSPIRFQKPTIAELSSYISERVAAGKPAIDPERFLSHYESVGWLIGKSPMKDWRAAVRTWEKNQKQTSPALQQFRGF